MLIRVRRAPSLNERMQLLRLLRRECLVGNTPDIRLQRLVGGDGPRRLLTKDLWHPVILDGHPQQGDHHDHVQQSGFGIRRRGNTGGRYGRIEP